MSAIRIGDKVQRISQPIGEVMHLFGSGHPGDPVRALVYFDSGTAIVDVGQLEQASQEELSHG